MPRDREAPARGGRSRRRNLPPPPGGCSAHASIPRLAPWATLFRPAGWRSVLAYFYAQIHASSFGIRNPATPKSRTRLQVDRGQPHAVVLILEQCVRGQNDSQYPAGLRHACLLQRVRPKPLSRADRCARRVLLSIGTPVLRPGQSGPGPPSRRRTPSPVCCTVEVGGIGQEAGHKKRWSAPLLLRLYWRPAA